MPLRRLIRLLRAARQPLPFLFIVLPLGFALGKLFSPQATVLRPVAMAAISLYLLPAIPIVMSSIMLAFDRLVCQRNDRGYLRRLFLVSLGAAIGAALLGGGSALLWKTGTLSDEARLAVGEIVRQGSEEIRIYLREQPNQPAAEPLLQMLLNWIVPSNLFSHLSQNETLKIIVASAGFGFTIHLIPPRMGNAIRLFLNGVHAMASRLLNAMLLVSPLIILILLASTFGQISGDVLLAMLNFIAAIGCAALVCLLIAILLTRHYEPTPPQPIAESLETTPPSGSRDRSATDAADIFTLGLSTANSITLYVSIVEVLQRWRFSADQIDTAIAINLLVARAGNILYNMAAIVFAINFYHVPVDASLLSVAILLAILTGLATSGLSGIAVVPVIALALDSLRIPSGPVIVLLLSIDPLLVMLRAAITGVVSLTAATLICSPSSSRTATDLAHAS